MKVILIRHGATMGNQEKRYIGITDEALCDTGIEKLLKNVHKDIYPAADKIYVSPMKRCIQTAQIIYPGSFSSRTRTLAPAPSLPVNIYRAFGVYLDLIGGEALASNQSLYLMLY